MGVHLTGCGWLELIVVVRVGHARCPHMYIMPVLDLAEEYMTFLVALHITWKGTLIIGLDNFSGFF